MLAKLEVNSRELKRTLQDVKNLFPKGSTTLPLGIHVENNIMTLTTGTDCILECFFSVECDLCLNITVLYTNLEEFIDVNENTTMEILQTGVSISNSGFNMTLPVAYSTVSKSSTEVSTDFSDINTESAYSGLKLLTGTSLSNMYKKDPPISVYKDVSVLKYPNVWVKARTVGFGLDAVLSADQCRLLTKYQPDTFARVRPDLIVCCKTNSTLLLPVLPLTDDDNFSDLLDNMSDPISLDISGYVEKLSVASKLRVSVANVRLCSNGITTTCTSGDTSLSLSCGDTSSYVKSAVLPFGLWFTCLKMLDGSKIQILYGENRLCLRTRNLIIVVSVAL